MISTWCAGELILGLGQSLKMVILGICGALNMVSAGGKIQAPH